MDSKLVKLNEQLKKLIEGKTKIVEKLNSIVGSSLALNSSWDNIAREITQLSVGGGYASVPFYYGLKLHILVGYKIVENDFGETIQII